MSEYLWDSHPPLLLKINTSKKTPPGNYEIFVTFTYSDGTQICVEKTAIPIHLKSSIERNQWKIAITGIIIAVTSPAWGSILSHFVTEYLLPLL